jgi:group I intron endonuclease
LLKHGYSKFSLEILEYCDPLSVIKREQHYLDIYQPYYNILKIAGSPLGRKHTEETKTKISDAKKGTFLVEDNHFYGKTHTEEARKKISDAKKGKKGVLLF